MFSYIKGEPKWSHHQKINTSNLVHSERKAASSHKQSAVRRLSCSWPEPYGTNRSGCRPRLHPDRGEAPLLTPESWLSWTVLHSHRTSTPLSIYGGTWRLRNPNEKLCGDPSLHAGWHESAGSTLTCGVHAARVFDGGQTNAEIFWQSWTFFSQTVELMFIMKTSVCTRREY